MPDQKSKKTQEQLAELIKSLDGWLGGIHSTLKNQQQSLVSLQAKSDDYPNIIPYLKSIEDMNQEFIDFLEDQIESLLVLRQVEPGIGSALLDFMYMTIVDPNASTQKQEFMDKLKKIMPKFRSLDKQRQKQLSDGLINIIDEALKNLNLSREKRAELRTKLNDLFSEQIFLKDGWQSEAIFSDTFTKCSEIIGAESNYRLFKANFLKPFRQLLTTYIVSIDSDKESQKQQIDRVTKFLSKVAITNFGLGKSLFKAASEIQVIKSIISKYEGLLDQLNSKNSSQGNAYINNIDQIISKIPEGAKQEDFFVAKRYKDYVQGLLFGNVESIHTFIMRIQEILDKLKPFMAIEEVDSNSSEEQHSQSSEQQVSATTIPDKDK